jgi:hypothetical protein
MFLNGRCSQVISIHKLLDELRDLHIDRAAIHTGGFAALQTAQRLQAGCRFGVTQIDFIKVGNT